MDPENSEIVPSSSLYSIPDATKEQPDTDIQQYKSTAGKKHCSRKLIKTSIILCLVLLSVSLVDSEVRIFVLYPAIAYLIFQVIEKAIEHFDLSVFDSSIPHKRL